METTKNHLFIFGNGYVAGFLAKAAQEQGFKVTLSSRQPQPPSEADDGLHHFGTPLPKGITHLVSTAPPDNGHDPILAAYPNLAAEGFDFIGYLSSTGVYGDTTGKEIDEKSPLLAAAPRTVARKNAEAEWLALPVPVHVFRLSGIYGPGRNMLERLKAGHIGGLEQSDRPVNRIHVADICQVVLAAMATPCHKTEVFNLADDHPAPTRDVLLYAARRLGVALPSPSAAATRSHLADGSRIVNCKKVKETFGITWLYPSYKEGLDGIIYA